MRESYGGEEMRAEVGAMEQRAEMEQRERCVFKCVLQTLTERCVLHQGKKKYCHVVTRGAHVSPTSYLCLLPPGQLITHQLKKYNSKIKKPCKHVI